MFADQEDAALSVKSVATRRVSLVRSAGILNGEQE